MPNPRLITEPWEVTQDKPTPADILRKHLETYPLYNAEQEVYYREDADNIYMNWHADPPGTHHMNRTTYFDVQITGKMFYLLHIQIGAEHRGKGLGFLLYLLLEEIAKELGCHTIEQTPSGWTNTPEKETRMSYVCRKLGYKPKGIAAEKDICPDGLLPDGAVCPRCGKRRGASGVDRGTWVHY